MGVGTEDSHSEGLNSEGLDSEAETLRAKNLSKGSEFKSLDSETQTS